MYRSHHLAIGKRRSARLSNFARCGEELEARSMLAVAPVAAADSYDVTEDILLTVPAATGLLLNDSDGDNDVLTPIIVDQPTHGVLTLTGSPLDGSFTYLPAANYNGPDSFTYKVNDGTEDSNTVTVTLSIAVVNDPPVMLGENYQMTEDGTLTISGPGVLANDSDVEGSSLTASLFRAPYYGTVVFNPNGSFVYTPYANFNGSDSFVYKATDGVTTSAATLARVDIASVNDCAAGEQ